MQTTISKALALQKAVRGRVGELQGLRGNLSTTHSLYSGGAVNETVKPEYDVKAVDKKITELELFLFNLDASIKESNAKTNIDMEYNAEKLLAPLS